MSLTSASGGEIFPIGIGTFGIASRENPATAEARRFIGYKNVEPVWGNESLEIAGLVHSLLRGQNYIDTAELYGAGYTNKVVGQAITAVAETIPRAALFISGNVWKSSYGSVMQAVESMLGQLGVDYLDAAGPHSPHTSGWDSPSWQTTMPAFRRLWDEGLIRGLTVSNFTIDRMDEAMELAQMPLVTTQLGFSAGYQREATPEVRAYCARQRIQIVAYQPLQPNLVQHETVKRLAAAHGATPAQVALAWTLQHGVLPITKTVNPDHIDANVAAVHVCLSDAEMEALSQLDQSG